jgi:NAD(P)-dependent dehydrogenase (short-subunit alcohol dehydrogenase family)
MSSQVVLITGALTGIGRATAVAFAHEGARVVVSSRHDDEGRKLATELRNLGTESEFVRTDVRHEEEVKNLVDKIIARFGRLDIAVNNAGTVATPGSAADVTPRAIKLFSIRMCLVCFSACSTRFGPCFGKAKAASSTSRLRTARSADRPQHCMSAASTLWKSSRSLRPSNSPAPAFVSMFGPGPTETGMFNRFAQTKENKANFLDAHIPTKRMGTPEEIANAILFIGSDKASYIIGASLAVDGRMLAG